MTIAWSLAMVIVDDKIDDDEQMHLVRRPFRWPRQCAGAIQTALPNAACPGLLRKVPTCSVSPQRPPGQQSTKQQSNNTPTLLAVSMAIVMQRYDTAHITRWRGSRASLEATGCHHRASTCSDSHQLGMPTPVF